MSEQKRVIYTKEELAAKVKVPASRGAGSEGALSVIAWNNAVCITDAFPESRQLLLWLINLL